MKRAALYARVSTEDQSDSGYSLPGQLAECRNYATRQDASVVVEFQEDASGAIPVTNRPQGARLFDLVKRHEIDMIIFHRVDRLSRDIVDLLVTVRAWMKAGIEVHAGDVGKIESDNDITLIIKGWQGADERKKIRERSMMGRRTKAKTGKVVGTRALYGYRHIRDEKNRIVNLEPVENEAEIVRLIYRWYVDGDESGKFLSASAIARRLSEMGVITPGEKSGGGYRRKRESGMWQPAKIIEILSHEGYAGVWHFGMRIGPSTKRRPKDEWIPVSIPAIVDRTTWEKAQERKARNKEFAKRNSKHDYLLSGLISCACGRAICGEYFSDHRYYSCSMRQNRHAALEPRDCRQKSIRADAIEPDVWESIVGLFSNSERLERLLRVAQQEEMNAMDPKREELHAVEGMIGEAEKEAAEIAQALKRASGIVGRTLEQNMQELNRRYDALCQRRDVLQGDLGQAKLTEKAIQDALTYAEDVRLGIVNADFETQRRNLETLQVRVKIDGRHFYVTSLIGSWDGEIRKLVIMGRARVRAGIVNDLCYKGGFPR